MGAGPVSRLTQEAQDKLDRYLRRVKAALRAHPSVDADEIERDIRGHIEAELAESPTPITEARLRGVLDRLGTPNQWVPAEDVPAWHRMLVRLRSGPEDWRLAYLTFALFIASPMTVGPSAAVLFFASTLLARATLALLEEEAEAIGARRWLVYPPLFVTYGGVALAIFLVPPALVASAGDPSLRTEARAWLAEPFWVTLSLATAFGAGAWWTLFGLLAARFAGGVRLLFWPFADWFERRHAIRIAVAGITVATIAAARLAIVAWMS
jgi:hypothetical protein